MIVSVRLVLTQKSRPYKIEIFGLQDNYIGTLQSYNDFFIGQVTEPVIEIKDDGSQSFTCSIPKFYINPENNLKVENPRWGDIKNGILAENTRVLKVFLEEDGETKVYPFIVDKITDKRDSHFSVYKEVEANGLAFAELGKQGYKLELNSHTVEVDLEKDKNTVTTIQYWLDKVFPNEKDQNGNIIKWLTPWCYELRMDWSYHTAANRASNKIYEDSYISSWALKNEDNAAIETTLEPAGFEEGLEKARPIECANSNKYNITQTLAETFGVFCVYEYKCDNRGQFIGKYYESIGDGVRIEWTGRKVIFYNRAIKANNPLFVDYQNNLTSISRTTDSTELYTKLYVTPVETSLTDTGYVSIADTEVNPLLDDFILNFDYLYNKGSITDYQYNYLNTYRVELHRLNNKLRNASPDMENLTIEINDLEAKVATLDKEIESAKETFQKYQTLRDNDVTNAAIVRDEANAYSVVFSVDQDCYSAKLRLEGINKDSIQGYNNYKYETELFSVDKGNLIISESSKRLTLTSNNENFYVLLNEYGYPSEIYTSLGNSIFGEDKTSIIYLKLVYSPSNAYQSICAQLQDLITEKTKARDSLKEVLGNNEEGTKTGKYKDLEDKEKAYDLILEEKELLNRKFELIMGPALREGYWTPETYDDYGQKVEKFDLSGFSVKEPTVGAELIFDSNYFDEEETGYYYDDALEMERRYYSYIPIKNDYQLWKNINIEDFVVILSDPNITYTVTGSALAAGNYYIIYDSTKYYFNIANALPVGTILTITKASTNLYLTFSTSTIALSQTQLSNAANLTDRFQGINSYLGERLLYNNAGFIFAFIKVGTNAVEPVILLNDSSINYIKYTNVSYRVEGNNSFDQCAFSNNITTPTAAGYTLYYPRIIFSDKNVNYKSDLFTVETYTGAYDSTASGKLEKYEDYIPLMRGGKVHLTLKITNRNNLSSILDNKYYLFYQISRANEMLYLDAKEVARENSQPKYSYELSVANVPDKTTFIDLGQLVYINDHALGVHAATGYISGIKLKLDKPQDDELTIQNYKTKFEDLFSTITASSEAMKNNSVAYDIAAAGFTSNGQIQGSVLQTSINNNNISFNFSNTNVQIDDTQGIILTNTSPYMNGVYGQVALRGGGIFLSNSIDENGIRIWSTGITPSGINASLLTAGQLDTSMIRIFAGNNLAFQWNPEGIFAYTRNEDGIPNLNKYVRYSDKGLQYVDNDFTAVDLGWNGLLISTQGGATELTGDLGLTVYYGQKNEQGINYAVRLGKFAEDSEYGLRLYKEVIINGQASYTPTLVTTNSGELWLQDSIKVGNVDNGVGITGAGEILTKDDGTTVYPVRIWAGDADKEMAPFWVREDGSIRATKATIEGRITAYEGAIGGWIINEDSLTSPDDGLTTLAATGDERINVNNAFIVNSDGKMIATNAEITGKITANSGTIGGLDVEGLADDLKGVVGDTSQLNVQIVSSKGTVANADQIFYTEFEALLSKGRVAIPEEEYANYYYYWEYSDDNETWESLLGENAEVKYTEEPTYIYENQLGYSIFVRCRVEAKTTGGE